MSVRLAVLYSKKLNVGHSLRVNLNLWVKITIVLTISLTCACLYVPQGAGVGERGGGEWCMFGVRQAQQISHLVCSLAGQRCSEAWGTFSARTSQSITALTSWRKEEWRKEAADIPPSKAENDLCSTRQILALFRGQPWGDCWETGRFVCWLLNVPATCECISGTDLHRQFYMLPHWDRSCRSNFPSHPVTVYWHWADQSQRWPYNARRLAG